MSYPARLSRSEKARVIGARSLQLALGAPAFVKVESAMRNPIDIEIKEFETKSLPINFRRYRSDGYYDDFTQNDIIES